MKFLISPGSKSLLSSGLEAPRACNSAMSVSKEIASNSSLSPRDVTRMELGIPDA
jgi:hypothetical protein